MSDRNPDNGRKWVDSCLVRLGVGAMTVACISVATACVPNIEGEASKGIPCVIVSAPVYYPVCKENK